MAGKNKKPGLDLQWKIFIGIAAGAVTGLLFNKTIGPGTQLAPLITLKVLFEYCGSIFIRLLMMLIVPLVFASLFTAVVNLGDIRKLRRIASKTLIYYLATTALAVLTGLLLVNIFHPGSGIDKKKLAELNIAQSIPEQVARQDLEERNATLIIIDTLVSMIPKNPAAAMAKGDMLQIIFFSLFLAIIAAIVGRDSEGLVRTIIALDKVMSRAVMIIMGIAPYGIFCLTAAIFMDLGFAVLEALGEYVLTVLVGLVIHAGITLSFLALVFGRYNPFRLFKAVLPAVLTAWSTASSAATLPVTMDCLEKRAGIDKKIGNFVLPLGATVNMDGTALYEAVAVIFIAELLGVQLTFSAQVVIFITATLAAIGAAAIPGAGLVTMGIVLTAVGLPVEGIGFILAVDRILDQFRTAVNVWGDTTAAVVVARMGKGQYP